MEASPTFEYRIISTDGHTIEPPHMWETYLPSKFHDRMPRLVKDPEGGDAWELFAGAPPMPLGLVTNQGTWGKRYEDLKWYGCTYESIRAGAFDGKARIAEQDLDGVSAEVLFPSQRTMGAFMSQPEDDYHLAGVEAYNRWMCEEFMAVDPRRLIGLYQVPCVGVEAAVERVREARKLGFRGLIISAFPSGAADLTREDDAFFEAAADEGLPVHIHSVLSQAGGRQSGTARRARSREDAVAALSKLPDLQQMGGAIAHVSGTVAKFIYSGLFDRVPTLQMVMVECGAGWIPNFLEYMDDHYWRNRVWTGCDLKLLPSDYFRRNWKATFIREPFAMQVRHHIGVDNLMWSNDYPHHRHDWPYSRRIIEESMLGVPQDEKYRMVCGNALELYRLAS